MVSRCLVRVKKRSRGGLCLFLCVLAFPCFSQSYKAKRLSDSIYAYNNRFAYEQSQKLIQSFLSDPALTNEDAYYAYLNLSFTYKRLFDYTSVLKYLDVALDYGMKTSQRERYVNNIQCQKALALFDIHRYSESDALMRGLAAENYRYIDEEYQSKLFMQEAYLLFLKKNYTAAETRYDLAMRTMLRSSPCDIPIILGKKIELYGALKDTLSMNRTYEKSALTSDSCGIFKYRMYTVEMMAKAFEQMGFYKQALAYRMMLDSLSRVYNDREHIAQITELEKKYEASRKEREIAKAKEILRQNEIKIATLIISLIALSFAITLFVIGSRHRTLQKQKIEAQLYHRKLFDKIEEERKRIATDLHDSIGHHLLALKTSTGNNQAHLDTKIDGILNEVRTISRNLHPVLFSTIGLKMSIEHLIYRLQSQHAIVFSHDINYHNELNSDAELQLYRIIQEALSNTIKYADAVAAKVTIATDDQSLTATIMDSGKGFNVKEVLHSEKAFGLHSIIQRSEALGGSALIESAHQKTTITIQIPIQK